MSFLDFNRQNLPADLASGAVTALIGSTFITVLERYAAELRANGGRVMLSGVHENVREQLFRTETTEAIPEDGLHMATDTLGASTAEPLAAAQEWLALSISSGQGAELESM